MPKKKYIPDFEKDPPLFPLPPVGTPRPTFKAPKNTVWTEHKAQVIAQYMRLFTFITKCGTYIDGFAGPQAASAPQMWAANLVLNNEPRWLRHFYLCDVSADKFRLLEELKDSQPPKRLKESKRHIHIHHGDCNQWIPEVLASRPIRDKEATFCLLDQHTSECHWETLRQIAGYKPPDRPKIEVFYFLAVGWIHRTLAAVKTDSARADLVRWWGDDWPEFQRKGIWAIIEDFRVRMEGELGYNFVTPYPIYERADGGKTMFVMIHATDHAEAPKLMYRAYNNVVTGAPSEDQLPLDFDAGSIATAYEPEDE